MLPLSYQGFGFTAILLMVLFLSAAEGVKWLRSRSRSNRSAAKAVKIPVPSTSSSR